MIHQVWHARQLRPAWSASLASVVAWTVCLPGPHHRPGPQCRRVLDHAAARPHAPGPPRRRPAPAHVHADPEAGELAVPTRCHRAPGAQSTRHAVRASSPGGLLWPRDQRQAPRPEGLQRRGPVVLHNLTAPPRTCAVWLIPTGCGAGRPGARTPGSPSPFAEGLRRRRQQRPTAPPRPLTPGTPAAPCHARRPRPRTRTRRPARRRLGGSRARS